MSQACRLSLGSAVEHQVMPKSAGSQLPLEAACDDHR